MHKLIWPLAALVLLGLLIRLLLPGWVKDYLNRRIQQMGPYQGAMADIDLHIWRGSYTIHHLRIVKDGAPADEPCFDAPRSEIAVSYTALLHGRFRSKVETFSPTVNFIDGKNDGERQTGKGVHWSEELNILIPAQLDEVHVH